MQPNQQDPYCQFKSDTYRHRALRFRAATRCLTAIAAVIMVAIAPADRWLPLIELLTAWRIWSF